MPASAADPLPAHVVRGLRREAFRQLREDSRRVAFPTVLRSGRLDSWPAEQHACDVPRVPHPGWARDCLESLLLARGDSPATDVWLTRPGPPEPDHLDAVWGYALHEVVSAYGLAPPRLFVVTRVGWSQIAPDAQTVTGQRWSRLRVVLPAA